MGSRAIVRIGFAVLLLAVQALQPGCDVLYEELIKDPFDGVSPSPERLDSPIQETGLVLVHVEMRGKGLLGNEFTYHIEEVRVWAGGELDTRARARPFAEGLAVFSGLAPGEYSLGWLYGSHNARYGVSKADLEEVRPGSRPEFTTVVEPGRIAYLGKFTFYARQDREPDVSREPEFEREALQKLRKRYGDSLWTPVIDRQLAGLDRELRD